MIGCGRAARLRGQRRLRRRRTERTPPFHAAADTAAHRALVSSLKLDQANRGKEATATGSFRPTVPSKGAIRDVRFTSKRAVAQTSQMRN
jgi:hypothetical protein